MIGHDDVFVQKQFGTDIKRFQQFGFDDAAKIRQGHDSVFDLSQIAFTVLGYDGQEIHAFGGIVPAGKAV